MTSVPPRRRPAVLAFCLAVGSLPAASASAAACPFCPPISQTLAEQVAQSDAVVLAQWVDGTKAKGDEAGHTRFEVVQVAKSPSKLPVARGDGVAYGSYRAGKKGNLFLLFGYSGDAIEWQPPQEITELGFQYLVQAPSPETPSEKRLAYFLRFLESSDETISTDAFGEFAMAPYKDIVPLTDRLPREKLRKWVADPETQAARLGLYGLMLGLCGEDEDAAWMERKITEPTREIRIGIDGIIAGYLLLRGEKGLDVIDRTKLRKEAKSPFSETFAAMNALRFLMQYSDGKIERARVLKSVRLLLDHPAVADLVIIDLTRWKDWSVQDRLLELFDDKDYEFATIRRGIVRYYLASIKDAPKEPGAEVPSHVTKSQAILETLRKKDPKIVEEAERGLTIGP
jgi:hypothetical protein